MKKAIPFIILALLLCACGTGTQEAAPAPAPAAAAEPTPEPTPEPEFASITDESAEEILALADIPSLISIDASRSREYDAILALHELLPECSIVWEYELNGQVYPSDTEELRVDTLGGLEDALRYLPNIKLVDLLACEVTTDDIDRFTAINPDADYLWWVKFGDWVVRSDITCFSSLRTGENHRYTNEELYPLLHYCKKLKALDLGHNDLTDLTDIGKLTDLQILIIADNEHISDLSPLADLKKCCYMEMFLCKQAANFAALSGMTAMEDLNMCYCYRLDDTSFLGSMPELRMLWCHSSGIGLGDISPYIPEDCRYVCWSDEVSSVCYGWRSTERNTAIRHWFHNFEDVAEFRSWDDVVLKPAEEQGGMDGTVKFSY